NPSQRFSCGLLPCSARDQKLLATLRPRHHAVAFGASGSLECDPLRKDKRDVETFVGAVGAVHASGFCVTCRGKRTSFGRSSRSGHTEIRRGLARLSRPAWDWCVTGERNHCTMAKGRTSAALA